MITARAKGTSELHILSEFCPFATWLSDSGRELIYAADALAAGIEITLPRRTGVIYFYTYYK